VWTSWLTILVTSSRTDTYFDNMTAYSLFHRPSFSNKVRDMVNPTHLAALFAAMFSISARFGVPADGVTTSSNPGPFSHHHFHDLALRHINITLDACMNEPPPLCLLQAMTLVAFYKLTNGVRGQAWRLLGSCVRIAYELRRDEAKI